MQIYKITNLLNNKIYIGRQNKNNENYFGSGKLIKNSIKKNGIECFKKEIIQNCLTQEELNNAEQFWIWKENSQDRNIGYNISKGGSDGGFHNEEHRIKAQKAAGISINKNIRTPRLKEKFKDPIFVKNLTQKIKETKIRKYNSSNGWGGKTHSKETKDQMRISAKGKHAGIKNSQFGTCWIIHLELKEVKKIQQIDLNYYLSNNWKRGRKI
jgi:hypothetical protein